MLHEATKEALMECIKSLKTFAYTRGDGPFFAEDRKEAEDNLEEKIKSLEKQLAKE